MEILIGHFTDLTSATNIIEKGVTKFPFHLTTNFDLGSTYGSHLALYKLNADFDCKISTVGTNGTTNSRANGCIEYVIENQAQLNSFYDAVECSGCRHCCHIQHIIDKQKELRLAKENKVTKVKKYEEAA